MTGPGASRPVAFDRPGVFGCDPHRCARVCCTNRAPDRGIAVMLGDLQRLDDAGLLDQVTGTFSSPEKIRAFRRDPDSADPLRAPRMRVTDGHCVFYDPAARSCTIHPHRPDVCRAFPYTIAWTSRRGARVTFENGCSLVSEHPRYDPSRPRSLPVLGTPDPAPMRPLDTLPPTDRDAVAAAFRMLEEQTRTFDLVAESPEVVEAAGFGRFLAPTPER